MKIKSITVEGFKSIYKKTTINFPDSGIWKISGDVGVGKTTLGECILFCLFGDVKKKKQSDLISWNAKKCTASINLESRGNDITINRVIRSVGIGKLDIFINGKPLEYTNKRSGQQILEEDYYDISRATVESLCIISFNNFRSIVSMSLCTNSNETKKFIDEVFGFSVVNSYIDHTRQHLSLATQTANNLQVTLNTLSSQREHYISCRDNVNKDVLQNSESSVTRVKELEKLISEKEAELKSTTTIFKDMVKILDDKCDEYKKEMIVIKERGKQLRTTINKLKEGICPLCGSKVEQSEIDNYNNQLQELITQYKRLEELHKESSAENSEFVKKYNQKLNDKKSEIAKFKNEIKEIQLQQELLSNNYNEIIKDLDTRIQNTSAELNNAQQEVNKWQTLYDKLYKESRPTLMKHYIPTLNTNINFYMEKLEQQYIIKFDETFKCSISAFGINNIPISSLSTGQSKLIDTAVILGIIKTLISGVNFNIVFFDELFSNVHAELRNTITNMLRTCVPNKLIYIITHAEMEDTLFDGVIKTKLHHWDEDDHLIQNTEYKIQDINSNM